VVEALRTGGYAATPASRRLVHLIESNAVELTRRYLEDVQRHPRLPTYRDFDQRELYNRAYSVYSQLGKWISKESSHEEVKETWTELGRIRRQEGFPLSEVILSLCLLRRHLWEKVQDEGFVDSAMDLLQALELQNRVVLFFDRAVFFAAVGYERAE
jgi:hypothetical protein